MGGMKMDKETMERIETNYEGFIVYWEESDE